MKRFLFAVVLVAVAAGLAFPEPQRKEEDDFPCIITNNTWGCRDGKGCERYVNLGIALVQKTMTEEHAHELRMALIREHLLIPIFEGTRAFTLHQSDFEDLGLVRVELSGRGWVHIRKSQLKCPGASAEELLDLMLPDQGKKWRVEKGTCDG